MRRRRCKNDGGVTGQSTTSPWKFDAVRQIRVDGAGVYNRATTFVAIADIVYAMTSFWPWSVFLVSLEPWAWGSGGRRPPFIELQEPVGLPRLLETIVVLLCISAVVHGEDNS